MQNGYIIIFPRERKWSYIKSRYMMNVVSFCVENSLLKRYIMQCGANKLEFPQSVIEKWICLSKAPICRFYEKYGMAVL